MLRKKQSITVINRRSVTRFFNRLQENFERKFDGFPALVDPSGTMPALEEFEDVDSGPLIDAITGEILAEEDPILQCSDVSVEDCLANGCSGQSVTEFLAFDGLFYSASLPVEYYVSVWINGLASLKDTDFTVNLDMTITLIDGHETDEVVARYVVA